MVERVQRILSDPTPARTAPPPDPAKLFTERAQAQLGARLVACEERHAAGAVPGTLLVVVTSEADNALRRLSTLHAEVYRESGDRAPRLEVIDQPTADLLSRLEASGLMQRTARASRVLFPHSDAPPPLDPAESAQVAALVERIAHQLKLARLLATNPGGFATEAAAATRAAIAVASQALALRDRLPPPQESDGPRPPWLAAAWGEGRAAADLFLADASSPLPPVLDALDSVVRSFKSQPARPA